MKIFYPRYLWLAFIALLTICLIFAAAPTLFAALAAGPPIAHRQQRATASLATRPVLAFYYTRYHRNTWCRCTMSDLPATPYDSSDDRTIERQIAQAAHAGITGFITSWPGPGTTQDVNLAKLLAHAADYERSTGTHFVTSIYFESDADAMRSNLTAAMQYAVRRYTSDPHFFRWHGKPVIFI